MQDTIPNLVVMPIDDLKSMVAQIIEQTWKESSKVTLKELRERWITVPEAAGIMGLSPTHITNLINANKFKYVRPKGNRKQLLYSEVYELSKIPKYATKSE